jgi:RNA polymerase sigma factor (sigma-70 family)
MPPADDSSMSDSVQHWIDRLRAGDPSARDQLLNCAADRLTRLTRKMIRQYPGVHRWEQTDDVLQNALVRLCRALGEVQPPTARDFFRLAAAQIRRELIDMARRYSGPHGLGANHASVARAEGGDGPMPSFGGPADLTHEPGQLAVWTEFHSQVEALGEQEREAFDLLYYQGISQAEAAVLLDVSERTIKRRWQAARLQLHEALGGQLPGI